MAAIDHALRIVFALDGNAPKDRSPESAA